MPGSLVTCGLRSATCPRRRGLVKYPGALALRWLDWLRGRNQIGRLAEAVHPATSIDERFDAFWERLRRRPDTLMAVRNRATLAWHLELSRGRAPATILVLNEGHDTIAGYILMVRRDQEELGLQRLEVADLQVLGEDPGPIQALVTGALHHARSQGIHLLGLTGQAPWKRRALMPLGPYPGQIASPWPLFYKAIDPTIRAPLASSEAWDPSPFDGDSLWGEANINS